MKVIRKTTPQVGREALAAGDWAAARSVLVEMVDSDESPAGELLFLLANAHKRSGAWDEGAVAMQQAYHAFVDEEDHAGAARAAINMVSTTAASGDWSAAKGWENRGRRHVQRAGTCVESGYLSLAWVGCDVRDPGDLLGRAEAALTVAHEFKDHNLELRALADMGLALVSLGKVDEGFGLLDEVMVALVAGEIEDPEWRCKTFCALMTACERTGDQGRAQAWTTQVEQNPRLQEMDWATTDCLVACGVVDALSGRWEQAEARLAEALEAVSAAPHHRATSAAKMAEMRIQQGRYAEAGQLLEGYEDMLEAAAALARLRMVEGKYEQATGLLRTASRSLGSDIIRLAPVLALLVDLELRRDDLAAAKRAARRLMALEEDCNSNEIRAIARLGEARIALHTGDPETAIDDLETAMALLVHRDRPLLAAQVRLELAHALAQAGEMASARVEAEASLQALTRLGVVPDSAAAQGLVEQLSAEVGQLQGSGKHPSWRARRPVMAQSLTPREEEVARLVAAGASNKEVAAQLFLSVRTVESHVDRALGKLDFRNRTQLAAWMNNVVVASEPLTR